MKKIAITTYWDSNTNYGQLLQGYSMQEILKKSNYFPFIIKYTLKEENTLYSRILNRLKNGFTLSKFFDGSYLKKINNSIKLKKNDNNKSRNFDGFRKRMNFSEKVYNSYKDIKKAPPEADFYLTGSDQVWANWIRNNTKRIFLLDFGPSDVKRIAYAASFGREQLKRSEFSLFKKKLKHFNFIGVREQSGLEICHKMALSKAILTADPTLLLKKNEWLYISQKPKKINSEDEFAFVYMVDNSSENPNVRKVLKFIQKKATNIYYVSSSFFEDNLSNFSPTIEEWLYCISKAKFVITSSFHGTIFCLLFNTPFLSVLKYGKHKQNTRIFSLLEMVNLEDRIVTKSTINEQIDGKLNTPIDWDFVNNKIDEFREKSLNAFLNALK